MLVGTSVWVTGDSNAKLECGVKLCVLVPHDRPTGEGEAEAEAGEPSDRDAGLTCEGVGGRKEHAATQKGFEKVSAGLMGSPGGRWSPKGARAGRLSCSAVLAHWPPRRRSESPNMHHWRPQLRPLLCRGQSWREIQAPRPTAYCHGV